MSRDAKEGVVAISGDNKKTSIIEVNCETDFVAKNENFVDFVKELSELKVPTVSDDSLDTSNKAIENYLQNIKHKENIRMIKQDEKRKEFIDKHQTKI